MHQKEAFIVEENTGEFRLEGELLDSERVLGYHMILRYFGNHFHVNAKNHHFEINRQAQRGKFRLAITSPNLLSTTTWLTL